MSRKLLALAGPALVVLGFIYIVWPVGHIPLYDANLVRLAETDLQGYCAGDTFWKTGGGNGNSGLAAECRKRLAGRHPDVVNLQVVQPEFCQAIIDNGWQGTKTDCLAIMAQNQYWPTYDGSITNQWNRARRYPQIFSVPSNGAQNGGSRTGGHDGATRSDAPTRDTYYPSYPHP